MAQLDQPVWRQAATFTLGLVSNLFASIREHGWILPPPCSSRQIRFVIITILVVATSSMAWAKPLTLTYFGHYKDHPVTVTYIFSPQSVQSTILGDDIQESNTTTLSNQQMMTFTQTTNNRIDDEFFSWDLERTSKGLRILFKNHGFNESFQDIVSVKKNPISLQGLLHNLQGLQLYVGYQQMVHLITPWKSIFPLTFTVESETTLTIKNRSIPAFKARIELDAFFKSLLPNTQIWISKESPHILLKQVGFNGNYELQSMDHIWDSRPTESR